MCGGCGSIILTCVGSSSVFCNDWCVVCTQVCALVEFLLVADSWRDAGWRRDVAKRIVVAASRCRSGAAACMILLSFAAERRKSYWNGCMKVAIVIFQ